MTGTPFDEDHVDQAGAELMLRERFDAAVGSLTPEIGRLVADGMSEGRGAVRRRRIVSGIAAAAVAIVAVGSVSYASQNNLFGKGDDHATNTGELVQLVPATSRGLAAALISHTNDLGTPLAVGGTALDDTRSTDWPLSAQVAYDLGEGVGVEIDAYATPDLSVWNDMACDIQQTAIVTCRSFTLPDGTPAFYLEYGSGAPSAGGGKKSAADAVVVKRGDQVVAVIAAMSGTANLVLTQGALVDIVVDRAVGMSTTEAFNTAGNQIADFKVGGLITSDSGSSSGGGSASPPTVETQPAQPRGTGKSSSATSN
jgi:hypothetical protein